jgi:polyisoprenoid-binding protein YceI
MEAGPGKSNQANTGRKANQTKSAIANVNVMKNTLLSRSTFLSLLLLGALATVRAEDTVKYVGKPGSEVKIDGTSNIHDWTVKGAIISGSMVVSSAFDKDLKSLSPVPKVEVTIPVRSLKSGNKRMDEVMQEHMNMKEHAQIKYELTGMTLKSDPKSPNGPAEYTSTGDLTVSGVKKSIEFPITIERVDASNLKITGTVPLKMTDFSIKPPAPALAMGLIKTGDDVKITLEWHVGKAEAQ